MYKLITEASIIGIVTLLLGKIIMGLIIKKRNKNQKHPKGLTIAFFSTGFILHFLIEFLGFNCWYCDKKCVAGIKKFI